MPYKSRRGNRVTQAVKSKIKCTIALLALDKKRYYLCKLNYHAPLIVRSILISEIKRWTTVIFLLKGRSGKWTPLGLRTLVPYYSHRLLELKRGWSGVSHPRRYWHLGLDDSFWWGAVLCTVGCLVVSLASTYWRPKAQTPPLLNNNHNWQMSRGGGA